MDERNVQGLSYERLYAVYATIKTIHITICGAGEV